MIVKNKDQCLGDYKGDIMKQYFCFSYVDFIYFEKYGVCVFLGGGCFSVCEIIGCVVVGVFCEYYFKFVYGIEIVVWVLFVGNIYYFLFMFEYFIVFYNFKFFELLQGVICEMVDKIIVWCLDLEVVVKMEQLIVDFRDG